MLWLWKAYQQESALFEAAMVASWVAKLNAWVVASAKDTYDRNDAVAVALTL